MYLSKYGYVIPKNTLESDTIRAIKKELVAKPLSDGKFMAINMSFPVYRETPTKLIVPVQYGIQKFGEPDSVTSSFTGESIPKITFTGTLREDQKEPYNRMYSKLSTTTPTSPKGGIMSLATGKGKTFLAAKLICEMERKTLVFVNKLSLLHQWKSELEKFTDNKIKVGVVQGKNIDIIDKHVIIATLQSVSKDNYPDKIFDDISMVIIDECHNVSSKMFSQVLFNTASPVMLGLSATPHRADGLDTVLNWHVSGLLYQTPKNTSLGTLEIQVIKCASSDYKEIHVFNKMTREHQLQFTSMLTELVNHQQRNKLIVDVIESIAVPGRKTLVMSDRREHIRQLIAILQQRNVNFTFAPFVGAMKIETLNENRKSDVILATTAAFSEGVSEKDLNTLVLVSPKKYVGHMVNNQKKDSGKMEQIVGRIFRKKHTEVQPLIIDIADDFSVYKSHLSQRLVFYKKHFSEYNLVYKSVDLDTYESLENVKLDKTVKVLKNSPSKTSTPKVEYCLLE